MPNISVIPAINIAEPPSPDNENDEIEAVNIISAIKPIINTTAILNRFSSVHCAAWKRTRSLSFSINKITSGAMNMKYATVPPIRKLKTPVRT